MIFTMTKEHLKGQYFNNVDCPYHRCIREKIKKGVEIFLGGTFIRFNDGDDHVILLTYEMIEYSMGFAKHSNGFECTAEPGFQFELPIPEEFLKGT
jgi:hypothetical protein